MISNAAFDGSDASPWWKYAATSTDAPADIELAVSNGRLCGTMTAGGKNVWDVIVGYSGLSLMPNQYYHISFDVTADTPRTIKFKSGLGDAPYTDYFIQSVDVTSTPLTATPQKIEYTYLNLRTDANAQFQFQIGKTAGTVCVDNIVLEPVTAPAAPAYSTPAASGHAFKDYKSLVKIGTAVDTPIFLSNPKHNSIVAGEFAMITPANSMKMNIIQPTFNKFDYTDTDALSDWAQKNGLEFRGHPLVWHTQVPGWLSAANQPVTDTQTNAELPWTRDAMIAVMYAHIDALMTHYKQKFPYWDVVNEAIDVSTADGFRSTIWRDRIGSDFMDLAFKRAREADPSAKLFYNDYNIEQRGDAKADKVFDVIKSMKDRGIPIDGVGLQGHYFVTPTGDTSTGYPDMQAVRDNIARYKQIGVDVQITECDFRIGKPLDDSKTQLQNKFYREMLQACIESQNCSHFTVWGLSDLDSWVPGTFADYDYAHVWDKNLAPKSAYAAMSEVLATYNADTPNPGGAGSAGAGGASAATQAGTGGAGAPSAAPSASGQSSGGCSFTSRRARSAPWLFGAFAMLGALVSRRRSKRWS